MKQRWVVWAATVIASCTLAATAGTYVNMEYVPIGNPGNPADNTGWGRVDHAYLIGKYEVTNAQYIAFLNAVAASDTYGLYNPKMAWEDTGGISRSGSEGSYTYGPRGYEAGVSDGDLNWLNRPVAYVSFWDACRFANWLHNGQPTAAQGPGTTEDGAYTLNGYIGSDGREIRHNDDARVWIPTENEWYKAAYYDPALNGGSGGYWNFPTGTNSLLNNNLPSEDTGDSANFCQDFVHDFTLGPPYYVTDVGAYELSGSPFGTFDQAGNVTEWTESIMVTPERRYRGGSYSTYTPGQPHMSASGYPHMDESPDYEGGPGFRVAAVPLPPALLPGLIGLGMLAWWKYRSGKGGT